MTDNLIDARELFRNRPPRIIEGNSEDIAKVLRDALPHLEVREWTPPVRFNGYGPDGDEAA